uniref:Uncharacterized protein n=1 Tax=Ciona intestinalis TaxID=7719 RepID=H2XZ91_CIOIN
MMFHSMADKTLVFKITKKLEYFRSFIHLMLTVMVLSLFL